MTRSFAKMYGLRAKNKSKMAIKRGFDDEDEEEVTEMAHPKNLNEAAHADKITKEAWAKVMVLRKAAALTDAPGPPQPPPLVLRPPQADPCPRDRPNTNPGPSNQLNLGKRTEVLLYKWAIGTRQRLQENACIYRVFGFLCFLFVPFLMVIEHKP